MNKKSLLKTKIVLMLVLLLLVILIPRIPSKTGVDKRLKPYLDEVVILSKGNLDYKGLHINFDNLKKETIGICYYNRKEILIDLNYFKSKFENILFNDNFVRIFNFKKIKEFILEIS